MRMRIRQVLLVLLLAACAGGENTAVSDRGTVQPATALPARLELGRPATAQEIAEWDIDVNPKGEGLPAGRGTAVEGAAIYAKSCASCHGAKGEGIAPNPRLVGRDPRDGFPFAKDAAHVKTVGNYWPYATTLFDYIRRTMPQNAIGSLSADETYAVVAWLLAENEIIARDFVIDAQSLPAVRMPARDRFVRDDRTPNAGFR